MGKELLRNIRTWLYRKGRYLDIARWNYHFENGEAREVLKALSVYISYDGSISDELLHGSDRNRASLEVLRILKELGYPDEAGRMIQDISSSMREHLIAASTIDADTIRAFKYLSLIGSKDSHTENTQNKHITINTQNEIRLLKAGISDFLENPSEDREMLYAVAEAVDDLKELDKEISEAQDRVKELIRELPSADFRNIITGYDSIYIESFRKEAEGFGHNLEKSLDSSGYWDISDFDNLAEPFLSHMRGRAIVDNMLYLQFIKPQNLTVIDRI